MQEEEAKRKAEEALAAARKKAEEEVCMRDGVCVCMFMMYLWRAFALHMYKHTCIDIYTRMRLCVRAE